MTQKNLRLFSYTNSETSGIVYCDRAREVNGNPLPVATLSFASLEVTFADRAEVSGAMREAILKAAWDIQRRAGEDRLVGTRGQRVSLGSKLSPGALDAIHALGDGVWDDPMLASIGGLLVPRHLNVERILEMDREGLFQEHQSRGDASRPGSDRY